VTLYPVPYQNSSDNTLLGVKGVNTQTMLITTIGKTAAYLKLSEDARTAILGYEAFNEPELADLPKLTFEPETLFLFYVEVLKALLAADGQAKLFMEPRVNWNIFPFDTDEQNTGGIKFVSATSEVKTYLPNELPPEVDTNSCVFSFHFYDTWTALYSALPLPFPDSMENKQKEWPALFTAFKSAGLDRKMVPFLTEFGARNDWKMFPIDFAGGYYQTQDRAYLDLIFQQIEANALCAAIWVCDFYATKDCGDNWNGEDFSILDW